MKLVLADITTLNVDAIVNAANCSLLGGGGVDGAIHRAAGPKLLEECRQLGGCPSGSGKLTLGYDLPAKFVIHCVGPIWKGGNQGEPELLQSCYVTACRLAQEHQKINSIAFPSISTGVYAYPKEPAAEIALRVCRSYCESLEIVFCCFSKADLEIYSSLFPDLVQIDQNLETIP